MSTIGITQISGMHMGQSFDSKTLENNNHYYLEQNTLFQHNHNGVNSSNLVSGVNNGTLTVEKIVMDEYHPLSYYCNVWESPWLYIDKPNHEYVFNHGMGSIPTIMQLYTTDKITKSDFDETWLTLAGKTSKGTDHAIANGDNFVALEHTQIWTYNKSNHRGSAGVSFSWIDNQQFAIKTVNCVIHTSSPIDPDYDTIGIPKDNGTDASWLGVDGGTVNTGMFLYPPKNTNGIAIKVILIQ